MHLGIIYNAEKPLQFLFSECFVHRAILGCSSTKETAFPSFWKNLDCLDQVPFRQVPAQEFHLHLDQWPVSGQLFRTLLLCERIQLCFTTHRALDTRNGTLTGNWTLGTVNIFPYLLGPNSTFFSFPQNILRLFSVSGFQFPYFRFAFLCARNIDASMQKAAQQPVFRRFSRKGL